MDIKLITNANNHWRIYNPIIKKIHISQDVRFDERYIYDSQLNEHNEKVEEFWSPEDDEQMAFQEKKQEDMIIRGMKKETEGDVVASVAMKENVRDQKKLLANNNNEFALSSLENNEALILPESTSPLITGFFPLE